MANSLFMLGSSYNKNKYINLFFFVSWIVYMFAKSNLTLGITFPLINAVTFASITLIISHIKNRKANTILSISSILIWSITIDIICYFMFPMMSVGQSLFGYIFNGILFNAKYLLTNTLAVMAIYGVDALITKAQLAYSNRKQLQEN